MSLDIKKMGGWGRGELGNAENPNGQANSYAQVTAYTSNTITIANQILGTVVFKVGVDVLMHVSTANSSMTEHLGKISAGRIKSITGSVITLESDLKGDIPLGSAYVSEYGVQVLTVPSYNTLLLSGNAYAPAPYSITSKCGGILAIKANHLDLRNGGVLNVSNKGIPAGGTRLVIASETDADTSDFINSTPPILNKGDGIILCFAKKISMDENSRIGNTTQGTPRVFGGNGGASILIAAKEIDGFSPKAIATTGTGSGIGKGRCRICIPPSQIKSIALDEMLYGLDIIQDSTLPRKIGIRNFGDGRLGDATNPTGQINTYARLTNLSVDRKTLTLSYINEGVYDRIEDGALVLIHVLGCVSSANVSEYGRYCVRKIASTNGTTSISFDEPLPFSPDVFQKYICQAVVVSQFNNLTLSNTVLNVTPYHALSQTGCLIAIATKGRLKNDKQQN